MTRALELLAGLLSAQNASGRGLAPDALEHARALAALLQAAPAPVVPIAPRACSKRKAEAPASIAPFMDWRGALVTPEEIRAADRALSPFTLADCLGDCARRDLIDAVRALAANPADPIPAAVLRGTRKAWKARAARVSSGPSRWTFRALACVDREPFTSARAQRLGCYLTRRIWRGHYLPEDLARVNAAKAEREEEHARKERRAA